MAAAGKVPTPRRIGSGVRGPIHEVSFGMRRWRNDIGGQFGLQWTGETR
jgi:hypothetical protein